MSTNIKCRNSLPSEISSLDPPGRFLKYDKNNSKWYEVDADESLAKTQQQFRNRVSMDRKALRKSKEGPKEKVADFRPENFKFNAQNVTEMSDASRVVLDLEIIEALGDIFLEVMDLNAKYANLNSKSFGSLVMNLPGRGQLKIFQAASTLVYATQADKTSGGGESTNKRPRQSFVAASANARPKGNLALKPPPPPPFVPNPGNPFVAPPTHGVIPPPALALQATAAATVPTTRPIDWVHPGAVANPPQLVPQIPPPAVGPNPSAKDKPEGNTTNIVKEDTRVVLKDTKSSRDTSNQDSDEEKSPAKSTLLGTLADVASESNQ